MKIVTVLGARPQFIKASAISLSIKNHSHKIEEIILHTGQHFDEKMSQIFFDQLSIPHPKYNLEISSFSHGKMTGLMIKEIEKILLKEKPDFVLVYGDTNSTLAAALAASKLNIHLIHIEAGLRSFNLSMPEEINRILTDRVSSILFCPTNQATLNLAEEGFPFKSFNGKNQAIINSGDIMLDVVLKNKKVFSKNDFYKKFSFQSKRYALCTIHRQENVDNEENLIEIISALNNISKKIELVLPIHPRTKQKLDFLNPKYMLNNSIKAVDPLPFMDMHNLIQNSAFVLTDSGGLQKEAFFHKVPCITLREETEWTETVNSGWNTLTGADSKKIIEAYNDITIPDNYPNLYGNGSAGDIILSEIINY